MSPVTARAVGASAGVAATVGAGVLSGGWWWSAAVVGAVAAVGSVTDRQLAHGHVLASLALVAGVASADRSWYVVVLAVGVVLTLELGAAADRVTVVCPVVSGLGGVVPAVATAALVSAAVLAIGALGPQVGVLAGVAASFAAVVAMRVIAR